VQDVLYVNDDPALARRLPDTVHLLKLPPLPLLVEALQLPTLRHAVAYSEQHDITDGLPARYSLLAEEHTKLFKQVLLQLQVGTAVSEMAHSTTIDAFLMIRIKCATGHVFSFWFFHSGKQSTLRATFKLHRQCVACS